MTGHQAAILAVAIIFGTPLLFVVWLYVAHRRAVRYRDRLERWTTEYDRDPRQAPPLPRGPGRSSSRHVRVDDRLAEDDRRHARLER